MNLKLETIWRGKKAKVKRDAQGGLRFWYVATNHGGFSCEFSLFCEVGEIYKSAFAGFFETNKLAKEPIYYAADPYVADTLEK